MVPMDIPKGPWGISAIKFFRWSQYQISALYMTLHDPAQVTGARCLADGNSAAALINLMNKEERDRREAGQEEEPSIDTDTDIARKDSVQKGDM